MQKPATSRIPKGSNREFGFRSNGPLSVSRMDLTLTASSCLGHHPAETEVYLGAVIGSQYRRERWVFHTRPAPQDPSRLFNRGTSQPLLGQVRFDSSFGSCVVDGPCSIPRCGSVLFSALEAGYQPFCGTVAEGPQRERGVDARAGKKGGAAECSEDGYQTREGLSHASSSFGMSLLTLEPA
jgi:hypothetical protein